MQVRDFSVYAPSPSTLRQQKRHLFGLAVPSPPPRIVIHIGLLVICSCWGFYSTDLSFLYPRVPSSTTKQHAVTPSLEGNPFRSHDAGEVTNRISTDLGGLGSPRHHRVSSDRRKKYLAARAIQIEKGASHKHGIYRASSNRTELLLERRKQADRIEGEKQKQAEVFLAKAVGMRECKDKDRFLKILFSGRLPDFGQDDSFLVNFCKKLPTEEQIAARFGPKAVVVGMNTCSEYRNLLEPQRNNGTRLQPMPRVAGLHHTGTNALALGLIINIQSNYGLLTRDCNVPWGKHVPPATSRLTQTFPPNNREDKFRVLPIVVIRDPFFWMNSMCKEWYDIKWEKPPDRRCPSIVKFLTNRTAYTVHARLQQSYFKRIDNYTSLPHLWSEWNRQYLDADYPRLMIRFEDILYRMHEVITAIRECVGLPMNETIHQPVQQSKDHGQSTDFLPALTKHLSNKGRHHGMTQMDREYSNSALDRQLMEWFGYQYAPLEVPPEDLEGPFNGIHQPKEGALEWWVPGFQLKPGQSLGPKKNTAFNRPDRVPTKQQRVDREETSFSDFLSEKSRIGGGLLATTNEGETQLKREWIQQQITNRRKSILAAAKPQESASYRRERIKRQIETIANNRSVT